MISVEKGYDVHHSEDREFFNPFEDLTPSEYYSFVTDSVNSNHIDDLRRKVELVDFPKGVLIAAVGSDGKQEQHAQSKTELIVIEEDAALGGDSILLDFFGKDEYIEIFDTGIGGCVDVKVLNQNNSMSSTFGDPNNLFPDRTLNMLPIHPITDENLELYFQVRQKTLEEMSESSAVKKELRSQLRSYKRSMRTGEYRHVPIFNAEESTQYYSELWPAYSTGFKLAFLRGAQRKVDLLTLGLEDKRDWGTVAREIPTNTLGRIDYLKNNGLIPTEVASATSEAYAWFLQQYHHIQEIYKQQQEPLRLSYDTGEFQKHSESIEVFVNL